MQVFATKSREPRKWHLFVKLKEQKKERGKKFFNQQSKTKIYEEVIFFDGTVCSSND